MLIRKNIGNKERLARLVGGALMIGCGLLGLHASPLGLALAAAGIVSMLTGIVRYCPACAMAGRKCSDN